MYIMPESYPCYVRIVGEVGDEDLVELPTENDGTILLSTIKAQYEDAIGLRFKTASGAWRGVRVTDGVLDPPLEGWGEEEYCITLPKKDTKRKNQYTDESVPVTKRKMEMTDADKLSDLICLGLPYTLTDTEFKDYFETFGELDMYELKSDAVTKKSRGFGFIRYKTIEAVDAVLASTHEVGGRKCEVRYPEKRSEGGDGMHTKLFIGRLAGGTTVTDLREHFSEFGPLKDVYVPTNFRGFGFVTFANRSAANEVMNTSHTLKGSNLNISYPAPKAGEQQAPQMMQQQQHDPYRQQQQDPYRQGDNMRGGMMAGGNMLQRGGYMQGQSGGGNMQGPQGGAYGNNVNNGYYSQGFNNAKMRDGK